MLWIKVNPHWSVNFQISFAISYFIFKHHVRNFWHLSCIEFDWCSTSIIRLFEAERSNANQLNTTAIILNASTSNAEFELSKTQMRKFFAKNEIIKIDFKRYIENHFRIYFDKRIYDYNLWFLITKNFEIFIINIWRLVFSNL